MCRSWVSCCFILSFQFSFPANAAFASSFSREQDPSSFKTKFHRDQSFTMPVFWCWGTEGCQQFLSQWSRSSTDGQSKFELQKHANWKPGLVWSSFHHGCAYLWFFFWKPGRFSILLRLNSNEHQWEVICHFHYLLVQHVLSFSSVNRG